jgi:hypothetical protein
MTRIKNHRYKYSQYDLYKIARKLPRGHLYTSREISKKFGYKKVSKSFRDFIAAVDYVHPYQFWVVKDEVAVPYEELPSTLGIARVVGRGGVFSYIIPSFMVSFHDSKNIRLFMVERNRIPFWKLKEYGGYL